jgi:hypothetical protein
MFEFFKDPFGTKRIAELRGEKTVTLFKMQQLVEEKQELHKKIAAKNAEVANLQTKVADLLVYEEVNLLIRAALNEEPRTLSAGSAALMLCLRYEAQLPKAMAESFKGVRSAMR